MYLAQNRRQKIGCLTSTCTLIIFTIRSSSLMCQGVLDSICRPWCYSGNTQERAYRYQVSDILLGLFWIRSAQFWYKVLRGYLHFLILIPVQFHFNPILDFDSKPGGRFGIGTWIDCNLNCSKFSVKKSKSCGSFGIFGPSPTLLCSMYVDTSAGQWPNWLVA